MQDLILNHSDVHHVFPRNYLKGQRLSRGLQPDCQLRRNTERDQYRYW